MVSYVSSGCNNHRTREFNPADERMVVPGHSHTTNVICLNKYGDNKGFYGSVSAAIPGCDGPGITLSLIHI